MNENFAIRSPKLPTGMITYWLIGRKAEGELTSVVTTDHQGAVSKGSSITQRR